MSQLFVDEIREHTSGAGIIVDSPVQIGGADRLSPTNIAALRISEPALDPGVLGAVYGVLIDYPAPSAPSGSCRYRGCVVVMSYPDTTFAFNDQEGYRVLWTAKPSGVTVSGFRAFTYDGDALAVLGAKTGLSIGAFSGGAANNYGILIGNVTGTGAFAIRTGLGAVQFGDTSSVVLGTITTDKLVRNDSVTWNASGVLFTGWKLSVTPTAYAANSRLFSLAAGGSEAFYVGWDATNILYTELAGISGMFGARVSSGPLIVSNNALWVGTFGGGGAAIGILGTGGLGQSNNVDQYGVKVQATPNTINPPTTSYTALYGQVISPAVSFTMASGYGVYVPDASKGAGSTITTLYGIHVADQTQGGTNYAIYTNSGTVRVGDLLLTVASVAGGAKFRLPHGTAPSSPVDGDVWTTTAGIFVRINGVTVGPLT